ncbi:hypothetical protein BOTBODRAFT_155253 [Botryobasidium botryosum FD-172 SS1]|uniref:Major facilitator superfamily (MFS) profile domain-containing protein n=1 Tax=Botryobasidium botryosum (strain FD-172 SS1) TaxID=930990 RepID=A0A067MRC9_BOTB1|nr:hypothetical protein BOTBODRAFT_155253 [Botryobasidium botryosum FD-172 SS1]
MDPTMQRDEKEVLEGDGLQSQADIPVLTMESKGNAEPVVESAGPPVAENRHLTGHKLFLVAFGILISVFLMSLDQTLVATSLPKIVSEFNALQKVSWIVNGYFLCVAGLLLLYGQLLVIAPSKWVYLSALAIFELGSLFCGIAKSAEFLIFGRAVAGVGGGGIIICCLTIFAEISDLRTRPLLLGGFAATFAVACIAGPLVGGAFADHVTWRWCFYLNLPCGAVSLIISMFLLDARPPVHSGLFTQTGWGKWLALDWFGAIMALGIVCTLLLPLSWGGNEKPWNDPVVIALFCVCGVLTILWFIWETRLGDKALMPMSLWNNRTQIGCCLEGFFTFGVFLLISYYLPLQYQATKGHSATRSGIDVLPLLISTVVGAGGAGVVIIVTGKVKPMLVICPLLVSIACGLLYGLNPVDVPDARLAGFQILLGLGLGPPIQNTVLAIQAEYAHDDKMVPRATSLLNFLQSIGGIIGIGIGSAIFANKLRQSLSTIPFLPPIIEGYIEKSVTVIFLLPKPLQAEVIKGYVHALNNVYLIGVPMGILGSLSGLLIRDYDLKQLVLNFTPHV